MDDATLINGLLAKRIELHAINSELREKVAVVANDIDAVERVLDSLGYQGEAITTPRAARIVLFYRNDGIAGRASVPKTCASSRDLR